MKCPSCGSPASGNFCSSCGAPLQETRCPSCGVGVPAGAKFCTACGAPLASGASGSKPGRPLGRGGAGGRGSPLAWWAAGIFLALFLVVLGYPILTRPGPQESPVGMPQGTGSGSGQSELVDLSTMSVQEQGTVLFNRVMSSHSAGDTADVNFFLPKALVLHRQLDPKDPDGLYHFALLHQVGGDHEAALAKAQEGLDEVPDHLLLLAVAGESSAALGDSARAEEMYRRFLEVYDAEMALMRPGYDHHQPIFPVYKEEAQAFLGRD